MIKNVKMISCLVLLAASVFATGCSNVSAVQTSRVKPTASPTPEYKPPKRVSRDVIATEIKEDKKSSPTKTK